jgi:hypothetical protein
MLILEKLYLDMNSLAQKGIGLSEFNLRHVNNKYGSHQDVCTSPIHNKIGGKIMKAQI